MVSTSKLTLFLILLLAFSSTAAEWTQMADFGGLARHRGSGFAIGNKGYIGLGHYNSGQQGDVKFADFWEFDPATNAWTQKADYLGGESYAATSFVIGDYAYVGSGTGPWTYNFYRFDASQNLWTNIALPPSGGLDCTSFAISGKGYFVTYSSMHEYDPLTDSWTTKSPPPITNMNWFIGFSSSSFGYVLYPQGNGLYRYDPSNDQWTSSDPFPGPAGGRPLSFCIEDAIYIGFGIGDAWKDYIWKFNSVTEQWVDSIEYTCSWRKFSVGFAINDKGYIGTGTHGVNLRDFWRFDPNASVQVEEKGLSLQVFPNPATDQISVTSANPGTLFIYDLFGKIVLSSEVTAVDLSLDISGLPSGKYYLMHSNGKVRTSFVKI